MHTSRGNVLGGTRRLRGRGQNTAVFNHAWACCRKAMGSLRTHPWAHFR
jgi:hypothetical protein